MVTKQSDRDRIASLLAAYGSDLSRWPAVGRAAVAALPPEERAALLREEVALDQLIGGAVHEAASAPPPEDLMARIVAATPAENTVGATGHPGPRVVELRTAKAAADVGPTAATRRTRDWVATAALLAASLALGIFVGSTDRGQIVAQGVGDLAGVSLSASSVQMTALDEALQSQDDEDIL